MVLMMIIINDIDINDDCDDLILITRMRIITLLTVMCVSIAIMCANMIRKEANCCTKMTSLRRSRSWTYCVRGGNLC